MNGRLRGLKARLVGAAVEKSHMHIAAEVA
jgi:hypothetical protein